MSCSLSPLIQALAKSLILFHLLYNLKVIWNHVLTQRKIAFGKSLCEGTIMKLHLNGVLQQLKIRKVMSRCIIEVFSAWGNYIFIIYVYLLHPTLAMWSQVWRA